MTIKERARLIRRATPACLKELFEMQNRLCDLCGHPIQDLVLAALDHSTPLIHFASASMAIEKAIAQANDLKNLRCAHAHCNHLKSNLTREEWFARGLSERNTPHLLTATELSTLRSRLSMSQRIGGLKNAASGQIAHIATPESCRKGGHLGGLTQGPKNAASGQITKIATPESRAKGNRASNHMRWHVTRGIENLNCKLCLEATL